MPSSSAADGVEHLHQHLPSGPLGPPPPPQSQAAFDDSAWDVVDAPHDMLINQQFSPNNEKGMACVLIS